MLERNRARLIGLPILVALWLVTSPAVGSGQAPSTSTFPAPGAVVRAEVRSSDGSEQVRGLFVSAVPEGVTLATSTGSDVWIDAPALLRLEVNRGRTPGAGASKGWKIGAVAVGGWFGLLLMGETDNRAAGFAGGAVVGGLAGSLLGGLIGAAVGADSWERIW